MTYKSTTGGLRFPSLLAVLFIGLKLTGYIDWSWWWVLAPLWLPAAIIFSIAGLLLVVAGIAAIILMIFDR